jgi:2-polyprenyl-3-methyl-5-hydroxy-6-metoxy-1,4-benzoquinol methylase
MYNNFSVDYDHFVNWKNRLAFEMPFLVEKITSVFPQEIRSIRILDAAAGTGMHAIALAKSGFMVYGSDLSEGMVAKANENVKAQGISVPMVVAGFGDLAKTYGLKNGPGDTDNLFHVILCLGNSLPHVLTSNDLDAALRDFSDCLVQDGMLILQNRNFDMVMHSRVRWMEPQYYAKKDEEWIFLRFYDYRDDGLINFNIVTLHRKGIEAWSQSISDTSLLPLLQDDLMESLKSTGFHNIELFGGMDGSLFDPETSGNLIIVARKK